MSTPVDTPTKPRSRRWLMIGLIVAVAITVFFGVRAVRRFMNRPSEEPIRAWMNIPYVARSYHVPPHKLAEAIGLPVDGPRDLRPLREIAKELGKTNDEIITLLKEAIARERPPPPPPPNEPKPTPTAE